MFSQYFSDLLSVENLISFVTLTSLETVLGIDNIIFIAILAGKLPTAQRDRARILGLSLAVLTRIGLLCSLSWIMSLTHPFITLFNKGFSGRDLILIGGGLFLIWKAVREMHVKTDPDSVHTQSETQSTKFFSVILQILLIDIIFSLDSVITAVGMSNHLGVMISAIIASIGIMLLFSRFIVDFVNNNPTIKILALAFLIIIGVYLVADGFGKHFEKTYLYFAMAFALVVEMINIRLDVRPPRQ